MAILQDQTQTNTQSMQDQINALLAENARLKLAKAKGNALSFKVTEKGGLSVYGLGRFPVTLYRGQWERLLGAKDAILDFIQANQATLSVKD